MFYHIRPGGGKPAEPEGGIIARRP